ncbi:hypothetical protein, partial [Shewanella sp. SR44-3]|uniref:hypothetical protein n=1 Tax=Shewanella sp. SR44-3 TaxID=2760936 RepID=UPI001C721901
SKPSHCAAVLYVFITCSKFIIEQVFSNSQINDARCGSLDGYYLHTVILTANQEEASFSFVKYIHLDYVTLSRS